MTIPAKRKKEVCTCHCDKCGEPVEYCECPTPDNKPTEKEGWEQKYQLFKDMIFCRHSTLWGFSKKETIRELDAFIPFLLHSDREQLIQKVERVLEFHKHNSVPSLTASLDEGCVTCVRNQALSDVISLLKEE